MPQGYKIFLMVNSTEHELILLINVKMPTVVGILPFISRINTTTYESFKQEKSLYIQYFRFNEQLKINAQLSQA